MLVVDPHCYSINILSDRMRKKRCPVQMLEVSESIDIRGGKRDWKRPYIMVYGKPVFNPCYCCVEIFNACLWGFCELLMACI